jgi:PPK2 family polyphosphate:nucleotide phosphotransferase
MLGAIRKEIALSAQYRRLVAACRIAPGRPFRLAAFDPAATLDPGLAPLHGGTLKERARLLLDESRARLATAQELLWASDSHALLVVLQGMDAAGKDGIVKHVTEGLNPQACEVRQFKTPTDAERHHSFLWRAWQSLPARGHIGIFNRSYYEAVLVERVHPDLLPDGAHGPRFWADRFEDINQFEGHLGRNGTLVLKFFLNVSKAEQRRRLLERLDDRSKNWKFSLADVAERGHWDAYMAAYEAMLRATSTAHAPWYVIPADHKYIARAAIASILCARIGALGLRYPVASGARRRQLAAARRTLARG